MDDEVAHPYLDLSRMEQLRHVRLYPRGMVEGTLAGAHRSRFRGSAVEFTDFREYAEGDDIRLVDWKVYARTDRHYVRLFEAERNLLTYLVVDTSGSMAYRGVVVETDPKLVYAARLAAAIGYLVIREGDEVGLSLATDQVHLHEFPRGTWPHLRTLLDKLQAAKAAGKTDLGACLQHVYTRVMRRGALVVLSDFLAPSPSLWKAIDLFRRSRFDVLLFHIVHPEELELPAVAMARFMDAESAQGQFMTEPDVVRELYRERFGRFLGMMEEESRARGCDWYLARTDEDPYRFLQRCFLFREAVR